MRQQKSKTKPGAFKLAGMLNLKLKSKPVRAAKRVSIPSPREGVDSEAEIGFKYVEGVSLCTESSYPFTGADASCQASGCSVGLQSGSGTGYLVVSHTASALIFALNQGPILVAIEADQTAFLQYKSGVVSQPFLAFKSAVIKTN